MADVGEPCPAGRAAGAGALPGSREIELDYPYAFTEAVAKRANPGFLRSARGRMATITAGSYPLSRPAKGWR